MKGNSHEWLDDLLIVVGGINTDVWSVQLTVGVRDRALAGRTEQVKP